MGPGPMRGEKTHYKPAPGCPTACGSFSGWYSFELEYCTCKECLQALGHPLRDAPADLLSDPHWARKGQWGLTGRIK